MKATPTPPATPEVIEASAPPPTPTESGGAAAAVSGPPATTAPAKSGPNLDWFDAVFFALALAVAFAAASFAARNSDLWLALAGGRLVAGGDLGLGADALSYSGVAAGRPWVHSAWLSEFLMYQAYQFDPTGAVLVSAKAALVTLAFGLWGFIRPASQSRWTWGLVTLAGAVAVAPYAQARPAVASMLFTSLTVLALVRLPWRRGRWREPLLLGLLTAVWANCDAWCLIGPLLVLLVMVGTVVSGAGDETALAWAWPPRRQLLRALLATTVAVFLNPSLLAGLAKDPASALDQMAPQELGVGASAPDDTELQGATLSPLSPFYYDIGQRGRSVSGAALLATVALVAGGVAAVARSQLSFAVAALGMLILAAQHVRLVPYFVFAAGPLAAAGLATIRLSSPAAPTGDATARVGRTAAGLGRVLLVLAALGLLAAAYPGFLHPLPPDAALRNRVEWRAEPSEGMARYAQAVERLHQSGAAPVGARTLNLSAESGNYLAYFAPSARSFVNGRYAYHRAEIPTLLTLRRGFLNVGRRDQAVLEQNYQAALKAADAQGAELLVAVGARFDDAGLVLLRQAVGDPRSVLMHLDGRGAVFGRAGAVGESARFDPAARLFDDPEPLPAPAVTAPPVNSGEWLDQFFLKPRPAPAEADDAAAILAYSALVQDQRRREFEFQEVLARLRRGAVGGGFALGIQTNEGMPLSDLQVAAPVLALRHARRAVAAAPDRPEGYAALAQVYAQPLAPVLPDNALVSAFAAALGLPERPAQRVTAARRLLGRTPPPELATPRQTREGRQTALGLVELLFETQQIDAAKQALELALDYQGRLPPGELLAGIQPQQGQKPEDALKAYAAQTDALQTQLIRDTQARAAQLETVTDPKQRFFVAIQAGMPNAALRLFAETPPEVFGPDLLAAVAEKTAAELRAGRLEDAYAYLSANDGPLGEMLRAQGGSPAAGRFEAVRAAASRLAGDYRGALAPLQAPPPPPAALPKNAGAYNLVAQMYQASALVGPTGLAVQVPEAVEALYRSKVPLFEAAIGAQVARTQLVSQAFLNHERALLVVTDPAASDDKDALRYYLAEAIRPQGVETAPFEGAGRAAVLRRYLGLLGRGK